MFTLEVLRSEQLSPSFQRVTVTGGDLASFAWRRYDHWFRLFVPGVGQRVLTLPTVTSGRWYPEWLATPERVRPHVSNYTVRAFRPELGELDLDVVLHRDPISGEVDGRTARWARSATRGARLGLLDQGVLFDRPDDASEIHLVAEETGLPAVENILGALGPSTTGTAILEVPTADDVRPIACPAAVEVRWVVRAGGQHRSGVPGSAALAALRDSPRPGGLAYAFVVGESTLATRGRRHFVRAGVPKDRITFLGYWRAAA